MTMLFAIVLVTLLRYGICEVDWWTNAVYYRVLVDSFKDSDGDGLGDIQGTTKQLSYIRALGADAVILSSISAKNKDCAKPGITDFSEIDQRYGTTENFNALTEKAKKLDLKLLVTLQLQTVSAESDWFQLSARRKTGYEDRIVWEDSSKDEVPQTETGVESWTWNEDRGGFYGSSDNETLLNLCSENVIAAFAAAQCFWLKRGVAGVVLSPDYTRNVNCGVQLVQKIVADGSRCARAANMATPIILVESSLPPEITAKYYGEGGVGAHAVISYVLTGPTKLQAPDLALALHAALLFSPQDTTPAWLTSSRGGARIMSRYGSEMVDSINLLALILPGSAVIQQGDELGAADTILEWASTSNCWPSRVTPSSSPFPWDDSTSAGFTSGEPWLPLAPNYRYANAKTEYANDLSHVGLMRVAAAMRKSPAIGPHVEIKRLGDALAILRWGGTGSLLYTTNLGRGQIEVHLSRIPGVPAEMTVAASSGGSSFTSGTHVTLEKGLKLGPGETVLLAGPPRHCGGPGPVDKIASKLSEGWQKINKYFSNI